MKNCKECERCIEASDLKYKQTRASIEDQEKYITVIYSVFFISLITMYSSIAKELTESQKLHFIVSYTISISFFAINEIINMIRGYLERNYITKQWTLYYERKKNLPKIQRKINIYTNNVYRFNFATWLLLFCTSVISGVYAVVSLLTYVFSL